MATQLERISALERDRRWARVIFSAVVLGSVTWLGVLTNKIDHISDRISHLEGKIGDPLASALQSIQSPSSTAALAANLDLLASQARVDRLQGKNPNPANLARINSAVKKVVTDQPALPEGWIAATALINYRSPIISKPIPICFDNPPQAGGATALGPPPNGRLIEPYVQYEDCEIDLGAPLPDAVNRLLDSGLKMHHVVFLRCRIIYRGGPVPLLRSVPILQFIDSSFDLVAPTLPSPEGQRMITNLLSAPDPSKVEVKPQGS